MVTDAWSRTRASVTQSRRAHEGRHHGSTGAQPSGEGWLDVANPQPHVAHSREPTAELGRGGRRGPRAPTSSPEPSPPRRHFHLDAPHPWSCRFSIPFARIAAPRHASRRRTPGAPPPVATRVLSTWRPALAHAGHVPPGLCFAAPAYKMLPNPKQLVADTTHTQSNKLTKTL